MAANAKIVGMLQKVLALKQQELSSMPRAITPKLKQQKQSRRFAMSAISRAIDEIITTDWEIRSGNDAMQIPGIGKGIAARIEEFLTTGRLRELEKYRPSANTTELEKVFGLGPAQARKLLDAGIQTVTQLKQGITSGHVSVSDQVVQGVLYYRDLLSRIPRDEMDFYKTVLNRIRPVLGAHVKLDLLGSYRRGLPDCGDLDVLVTSKADPSKLLNTFLTELSKRNLLVSHLGEGQTKFAGILLHPKYGIARRIDVRYVPADSYPFAVLYYTGSAKLNVIMRQAAIKQGLSLSEYGLKDKLGKMVRGLKSERDIFAYIGLDYIKPEDRNH